MILLLKNYDTFKTPNFIVRCLFFCYNKIEKIGKLEVVMYQDEKIVELLESIEKLLHKVLLMTKIKRIENVSKKEII